MIAAIIFQSLFIFVVVYCSTIFTEGVFFFDFLVYHPIGKRLALLPKPFSCSACLAGWTSIVFWSAMGYFAGFFYVTALAALLAGWLAARYLNSDLG